MATQKKTTKLAPLHDRVVVVPVKEETKTVSGIIIPDTASKERPEQGKIVAVGEGKREDGKIVPLAVKVGDIVLFSKYGHDEVKIDGEDYFIMREDAILAIIK